MANRVNLAAQRASDVAIGDPVPGAVREYIWKVIQQERDVAVNAWKHSLPITRDGPDLLPRVIRVQLESETAQSITADTVTWDVAMPSYGALKPGTLVVWENVFVTGIGQASNTVIEFTLGGINCMNRSSKDARNDFRVRALCRVTDSLYELLPSGRLPQATLVDSNILQSGRVSLTKAGGLDFGSNTVAKVTLLFIEPGAATL